MRSLKIVAPRQIEFFERPEPRLISSDDVKIQVKYVGICEDDMPFFRRNRDMLAWGSNLIPFNGHEMSGVVVECGENASRNGIKVGDRVSGYAWDKCGECYYCKTGRESHCLNLKPAQGTLSDYIVWKARQLLVLPDDISFEEGCLTDPIGYALHGADVANITIGDSVLIIGGTINAQLMVQMVRRRGAVKVTVVSPEKSLRKLAESFGASYTIDPVNENIADVALNITDGLGYDVIFETSGETAMMNLSTKLVARHGRIVYATMYAISSQIPISMSELYLKEASLIPYYMAPYILPRVKNIMSELQLKPLITKVYDYNDAAMAYKDTETGLYPHILVKVSD